jgi:hypothetical protein
MRYRRLPRQGLQLRAVQGGKSIEPDHRKRASAPIPEPVPSSVDRHLTLGGRITNF